MMWIRPDFRTDFLPVSCSWLSLDPSSWAALSFISFPRLRFILFYALVFIFLLSVLGLWLLMPQPRILRLPTFYVFLFICAALQFQKVFAQPGMEARTKGLGRCLPVGCWLLAPRSPWAIPCQDGARVLGCLILQSGHNKYLTLHKSLKSCQKQGLTAVSSAYPVATGLNGFATFRRSTFMLMTWLLQLEAAAAQI